MVVQDAVHPVPEVAVNKPMLGLILGGALGALDGLLAAGDSSRLGMVRAPTLLLWGEHDGIFSAAAQRDLQRGIAAAKLQVYSGAGHAPHWETPDRVVRDLRQFVGAAR